MDSSTSLFGQIHFQFKGCLVCVLALSFIREIPVLNANSADPDRTSRFAAYNLSLHYFPMSLLLDAMHNWLNMHYL